MFPEAEELKLKASIDKSLSPALKKFFELKGKSDIPVEEIEKFVEDNIEQFIEELADRAMDFKSFTKSEFEDLLKREMESSGIDRTKSWIEKNLTIYLATPEKMVDKINNIRYDRIDTYRKNFNKGFDVRIEQERFTARDIDYIKAKAMQRDSLSYKQKEYLEKLGDELDALNKFSKDDMEKLKEWMYRRNELWSRDQAGDIYASECEELSLRNGIEFFKWNSEQDSRTRPEHMARHGRIFSFKTVEYLPGQQQLCRCWIIPIKR